MGAGKRKKLCGGLWACLKFSLRIYKHSNNDDDKDDDDYDVNNDNKNSNNINNNILWHSTAHSNLLSEGLKIKENSGHNEDAPVLYEQVL
jgi:hypothetical protein